MKLWQNLVQTAFQVEQDSQRDDAGKLS